MTQATPITNVVAAQSPERYDAEALSRSFEQCAEVVRQRARNFYHGLRITPEPRRSGIYAIYAWMRRADDAVDRMGTRAEKCARLDELADATERVLTGRVLPISERDVFVWPAFIDTVHRYRIAPSEIRSLLDGMRDDLQHEPEPGNPIIEPPTPGYATRDDLAEYCYKVASVVGRICVRIWGLRDRVETDHALRLAERRGLAFQLTNVLRDYREDYDEGRVYLPAEAFDHFGVTPAEFRHFEKPDASSALARSIAYWAAEEYAASAELESMIRPDAAPAMWAMTRIYRGLLEQIERDPPRIVSERRVRLASLRKAGIGIGALIRAKLGARRNA